MGYSGWEGEACLDHPPVALHVVHRLDVLHGIGIRRQARSCKHSQVLEYSNASELSYSTLSTPLSASLANTRALVRRSPEMPQPGGDLMVDSPCARMCARAR